MNVNTRAGAERSAVMRDPRLRVFSSESQALHQGIRSYYSVCVRKEDSYLEKILLLLRFYRHSSVKIFTCSVDKCTKRSNVACFQTAETVIEMFQL